MRKQVEIFTDGSCLATQGLAVMARLCAIVSMKKLLAKAIF